MIGRNQEGTNLEFVQDEREEEAPIARFEGNHL